MLSTSLILTLGASAMAATVQRDLAVWTLQGCYTDISTSRTLAGASTAGANMTVEACQAFCSSGGYNLAGVEYGSECYCDHALQAPSTIASAASCNMPCSGNKAEVCGAGNFINVYWNGQPFPVAPPLVGTWGLQGCFADNVNSRALPHQQIISGMTIEKCTAACKANGYNVAGLEFGQECWCNSQLPSTAQLNSNACQTACLGNSLEFCGGSSKLSVYVDSSSTQTCLTSTQAAPFNLQANFVNPPTSGPSSLPVRILMVNTVPKTSWDILSAGGGTFTSEVLTNGGILGSLTGQPQLLAASIAVIPGDSPTFVTQQFLPTSPAAYCIMPNPFLGPTGPNVLGVNGRSDQWALCANSSASGRMDLVFSPLPTHPHYNQSSCQSVYLTLMVDLR